MQMGKDFVILHEEKFQTTLGSRYRAVLVIGPKVKKTVKWLFLSFQAS